MSSSLSHRLSITMSDALSWISGNKLKTTGIASVATVTGCAMYYFAEKAYRESKRQPPGPTNWPLVGSLPTFLMYVIFLRPKDKDPKDVLGGLEYLTKVYGDILMFSVQNLNQIWITNSALSRKVMTDKRLKDVTTNFAFSGQFILFTSKSGQGAFSMHNGELWMRRRKMFLAVFNKMLTTKFMNKVSGTAIKKVLFPEIDRVCSEQKQPYKIREMMQYTAFQTIFYANFDRFVDKDDEVFMRLKKEIEISIELSFSPEHLAAFVYGKKGPQHLYDARDRLSDAVNEIMDERRAQLRQKGIHYVDPSNAGKQKKSTQQKAEDLSMVIKDLEFDSYLDYLLKLVNDGSISNDVAEVEVMLIFNAGYQNNALLLEWVLVYLAKYPEIQQRVRAELFRVHQVEDAEEAKQAETVRDFDLSHVVQCSLLRAFVHETLRTSSFARNGIARYIDRDGVEIEWQGKTYSLPKGYMLQNYIEFVSTMSSKENWQKDENGKIKEFDLDNFLDSSGRFKVNDSFISFGLGSRDCPGKAFAVKFILINAAYLIMNYQIEFGEEEQRKNPTEVEIKCNPQEFLRKITPEIPLKFTKI